VNIFKEEYRTGRWNESFSELNETQEEYMNWLRNVKYLNNRTACTILVLFFALAKVGVCQTSTEVRDWSPIQYVDEDRTIKRSTSILAILANPWRFHGKEVIIRGYVAVDRDTALITYAENVFKREVSADVIFIDYAQCTNRTEFLEKTNCKWWTLVGVVDASKGGYPSKEYYSCVFKLKRY
jgi:hypothetical protein